MDAEHAGQDGGGQVGGELEQRGGSGLCWAQAELAESFGELVGADRAAGLAAGEQPWRCAVVADGGVPLPARGNLADEVGEWFGKDDRLAAQTDPHVVFIGIDVVEGEAADAAPIVLAENNEYEPRPRWR